MKPSMAAAAQVQRVERGLQPAGTQGNQLRTRVLVHALWLAAFLVVFAPTLSWLWQRWTISVWQNAHGLFIPVVVAGLVRARLRSDPMEDAESSAWGFAFLISGLMLLVIDSAIRTQLLSAIALVVCLPGLSLLLLGARRTRELAIPLGLTAFMLPIPSAFVDGLQIILRHISATGAEHLVRLVGATVSRDHLTLHLGGGSLEVADACSGFSTLYASVTVALILAYLTDSRRGAAAILLAAVPSAIGSNVLRCSILALLVDAQGVGILATSIHPLSGMFTAVCAAGILFVIWDRSHKPAR